MSRARVLANRANQNTLAVETDSSEVGISSTSPRSTLDIRGEVQVGTAIQAGVAGVITATSFSGSGSNLTGVANTDYVVSVATTTGDLKVSAAATITGVANFSSTINADATTDSTSTSTGALIVDGGVGIAKNVYIGAGLSVAGTLTYEDVTSVDSVGLITAKSGVNVSGGQVTIGTGITMGIAGVATFSGTGDVHLLDNVRLNVGDGSDLSIWHNGTHSYIQESGSGALQLRGANLILDNADGSKRYIDCNDGSDVHIFYNNSKKFETTNNGSYTTGIHTATGSLVAGVNADTGVDLRFRANRSTAAQTIGNISGYWNETVVGQIRVMAGDDTTNKDDGHLVFFTAPSGSIAERLRITSGGAVGVGTTNPQNAIHVESASNTYVQISKPDTASNVLVGNANGDCIIESTGGQVKLKPNNASNKFILDTSGRVLVNHSTSRNVGNITSQVQIEGTSSDASISICRNSDNSSAPYISLAKSRGGAVGGTTVIQDDDGVGTILFSGADGTDITNNAASIAAFIDGAPGGNDTPGRLTFNTTADGGTSPTERLRITSLATFDFTNGALIEKVAITAGKLSDNTNINLGDGMVHYFTTQESTTCTPNIRVNSSVSLNDIMNLGDVITVTVITTAAAGGYSANWTIDGNAVTEEWVGGSAPSAGGSDGLDIYVLTIICTHATNTGDSGFKVIANLTNAT